jgi:hypothetical protein
MGPTAANIWLVVAGLVGVLARKRGRPVPAIALSKAKLRRDDRDHRDTPLAAPADDAQRELRARSSMVTPELEKDEPSTSYSIDDRRRHFWRRSHLWRRHLCRTTSFKMF